MSYFLPIASALVTILLIVFILSSKFGNKVQDIPNERSLHSKPVPRTGGVGLMAGVLFGWMLGFTSLVWWVVLPMIGLFAVSFLDDMLNLSVKKRFLAHFIAAGLLVVGSGLLTQSITLALCVLLFTVWMTNLYNFMDGSNGLAGGMALFGFSFYGIAALIAHHDAFAMLNLSISAAALGFLFFNFHPARIFMGDAGSIPLGFLAAAMGLWGWQQGLWGVWFPLMVFSPFVVDASVTLARRTLRGVKITEAHREHYYQRAIQMGWSHRSVALVEYVLMIGCGLLALRVIDEEVPLQMLFVCGMFYILMMLRIDLAWSKFSKGRHA